MTAIRLTAAVLLTVPLVVAPASPQRPLGAGFRYSAYGPAYDPGPAYWARVGREMAGKFAGAHPEAIWIVGRLEGRGVRLSFPVPAGDPLIKGTAEDESEAALALFDEQGFKVWLQVEPGFAPVERQIHLMLERYAHHRCVQGVGVDLEWNRSTNPDGGEPVSDAEAAAWLKAARQHNPAYRLFLKHFKPDVMPPTLRDGLVFVDDSQIFPTLDAMVAEFAAWGRRFAPAPVSFQFGYQSDRPWWSQLKDPPAEIGRRILAAVPNTESLIWVDFSVLEVFPPAKPVGREAPIVGVKIYDHKGDMAALFDRFAEAGINTVFCSETLAADAGFRRQARDRDMKVFVIEPIFFDAEALKADPDLYAITNKGERAKDDWVEFVCPTREAFRERKIAAVRDAVRRLQPDGVSLDFIRYFVYWEMVHPDRTPGSLPDTCYCPHCLARFQAETGVALPAIAKTPAAAAEWIAGHEQARWVRWKTGVITSMARDLAAAARQAKPGILVNLHAVPWRSRDFDGAIRRVAGQDLEALSRVADFVSPMCYTLMQHRRAAWVHSVVRDMAVSSTCPILPSIQVRPEYPGDDAMSAEAFEKTVTSALAPPSRGVVFWSWAHLAQEPGKMAVLKEVLGATSLPAELAGAWAGTLSHGAETQDLFVELEPSNDGNVTVKLTVPVIHIARTPMARAVPEVKGDEIRVAPFTFRYDRAARTLSGTLPEGLAPVYRLAFSLHRVARVDVPVRPDATGAIAAPAWTYDTGAPCWPGVTAADDIVLAGCDDGRLHALDAASGRERWSFRAGGRIRTRATVSGRGVYLQADDGMLYALDRADGSERWKVRVVEKNVERLPFDDPKSRFDRFGSDVTAADGRLYLGTHDGRILAVDPTTGARVWEFATGDSVLAAPAVDGGRVYAGSLDKHLYALDAATGRLLWKRDTGGGVVSTPALEGGRLVVGNRAYDLLGLRVEDGSVAWKRYIWFSWVESSATIRDGVAYVGSSDAAALFAFDVRSGRSVWKTDVRGWAWGQPAVAADRVYIGTANQPGYLGGAHQGGAMAVDRRTGAPIWRVAVEPGKTGPYGFPGSPAVGEKLAYFAGLDGKIYAFAR